jgi:hypothetical protein
MATRKSAAKTAVKKAARPAAKKAAAKKTVAKKAPAKKAAAKKTAAKKAPARKSARSSGMTVSEFVKKLGDWRGEVVSELRSLIKSAAPEATESIKWGQPVYEAAGPFAYINAFKRHVNFGFWRGAELLDPKGMFKGTGSRMRHIELKSLADLDRPILEAMVRTAVGMNRAKGDPTKRGARR